jgi:hypothetical protein
MVHFWRCIVFSVFAMEAVSGEDGSQSTSIAAPASKLAAAASTTATPTKQDAAQSVPPAPAPKSEAVGQTDAPKDGHTSRSLSVLSTTLEAGHANAPAAVSEKSDPQHGDGSAAEHDTSATHEDEGTEEPQLVGREAEPGELEVQRESDEDPKGHMSEFSPRCLALIGALVSFIGVLSYSFAVLCHIFRGRQGATKPQKLVSKAPETKQSSQLEDLESAYDADDWGNDLAPSSSVVRKTVQSQQSHEAEEDTCGWENDISSDAGWQNDSWCDDDWSDAEVSEKCQAIGDDILEAAIVSGRHVKPSYNGPPPKGKAD